MRKVGGIAEMGGEVKAPKITKAMMMAIDPNIKNP